MRASDPHTAAGGGRAAPHSGGYPMMRRREFITLLGGAAAAWPLPARSQQGAIPVVGYFHLGTREGNANSVAGFRKGLSEMGYVEGRNVVIEFLWGDNQVERLPEMAAELVRRGVTVISI